VSDNVADASIEDVADDDDASGRRAVTIRFEPNGFRNAVVWVFVIFAGFRVAMWLFESASGFLFLMLLAWLLSIAMEPAVAWFANRGMRRGLATGLVVLLLGVATVVFLAVFGGVFFSQLEELVRTLPNTITQVVDWVNQTFHTTLNPQNILDSLDISASTIAGVASNLAGGVFGLLGVVFGTLFDAVTVLVFAFYFSADAPRLRRTIGSWLPSRHQKVFVTVWDIAVNKTGGFVVSKVILATMSAFFHSIFFFVIHVPFWLAMGIFAGIVSQFIPTIGTYIGVLIPAVFAVFEEPIDVVWIVIFATIYQQIESYIFTPRVSRVTMDVHPALALAAVFVGVGLFGPIGAIIGIPLTAAVVAVVETYGQRYELLPELRARTRGEKPSVVEDEFGGDPDLEVPAGTPLTKVDETLQAQGVDIEVALSDDDSVPDPPRSST
jgi:predicted PurR-regulated permease PerM